MWFCFLGFWYNDMIISVVDQSIAENDAISFSLSRSYKIDKIGMAKLAGASS